MSWIRDIKKELKKVERILFDPIVGRYARRYKDFLLKLEAEKSPPQKILTEREKERIERKEILERTWDRLETTFNGINKISDDNERRTLLEIARNYNYRKHSLNFYLDWQGRVLSLQLMDVKHLVPENLSCFSHLMDLSIFNSNIQNMRWLRTLIKLRELNLSKNNIQKIEGLENLKHLEELNLYKNQIRKIEGLESLYNLKKLDLSENCITEIKGFDNLTNLKYLNLRNNQITKIKGLDNLKNLESLYLNDNQITEIKGLDNFENIVRLGLSNNNITEIKGLRNLITLFELDLCGNKIAEFKGIDELINLYRVRVNDNPITKILPIRDVPRLNSVDIFDPERISPGGIIEINRQLEGEGLELCYVEGGSYLAICQKSEPEDTDEW